MGQLTLTTVAKLLKSEWILIFLGTISLAIFSITIFSFTRPKIEKAPQGAPWQNQIYAGTTTKEELKSLLGSPIKVDDRNGQISYFYSSANQYRPHEVNVLGNTVNLIKEQVIEEEKGRLADYTQKYDQPERKLYGKHGAFAPGHFWSKAGLLIFANEFDGKIIEIWYFSPTTLENFLQQYPELTTEKPQNF